MSPASHGGGAQKKAEDQDVVSRLLHHGIAVEVFNQRETGELHMGGGFYRCALGGLFGYLLEQEGGGNLTKGHDRILK